MSALAFSFSHPQAIYVALKKKKSECLEETNAPCHVQTLSRSDGQELRSQHPCAFLPKQEVRVGERDLWTTERKKQNKNWNDQFRFHSGNRSLLENKMRKNLCHHAGSQQWAESAELVAQQGNISQQQLAVTHGGQPLTPCWLLLFGSLPFLRRLYEAMDDCLPQRATLHTPGVSVTVLWL